jgi:hypothetical protein
LVVLVEGVNFRFLLGYCKKRAIRFHSITDLHKSASKERDSRLTLDVHRVGLLRAPDFIRRLTRYLVAMVTPLDVTQYQLAARLTLDRSAIYQPPGVLK